MEMETMNKNKKCIHWICFLVFIFQSIVSFAMPVHFEIVAENVYGEEALIIDVKENDIKIIKDLAYSEQGQQLVAGTLKVETEWPFSVVGDYVTPPSIDKNVCFPGYYDYTNLYCRVGTNVLGHSDLISDARVLFVKQMHSNNSYCSWSSTRSPDLCVVLVDSLRPDHLGCYGYERDTSPAVDAFAAGAVRFDQAIASGSWTQPSIMSMMASVPADIHQRVHWGRPHSTNVVTLAETLRAAGYQTVGLVANPMTNRKYGFARGFDFYDDYSLTGAPDATTGDIARQTAQGAKLTRLARDWIEKRRDPEKPLFLFILYIDVHWDYLPPPPFNRMFAPDPVPPPRDIWNLGRKSVPEAARRRSVAAYDGEIRYTDGCISNLLAAIDASPRGKDTVVVFCSDHGESFWERGVASHGNALFDEELRVPLVIRPARGDGEPAPPRVVSEQVGLIDLAPTLADLAGVPAPTNWIGRSLAPALRGETLPEAPIVLDNRIGDDGAILRGVRTSRWKVIAGPPHDRPTELYDLRADPAETNDLLRAGGFALPPEVEALVPLLKPAR